MNIAILAARNHKAQERMIASADRIGLALGLQTQVDALRNARNQDADVDALFKREAIADLLQAIAAQVAPAVEIAADQPPVLDQAGSADADTGLAEAGADETAPAESPDTIDAAPLPPPVVKRARKAAK